MAKSTRGRVAGVVLLVAVFGAHSVAQEEDQEGRVQMTVDEQRELAGLRLQQRAGTAPREAKTEEQVEAETAPVQEDAFRTDGELIAGPLSDVQAARGDEEYTTAEIRDKIKGFSRMRRGGAILVCAGVPTLTAGILLLRREDDYGIPFWGRPFGYGSLADIVCAWTGLTGTGLGGCDDRSRHGADGAGFQQGA
jgi:hypothetical protein